MLPLANKNTQFQKQQLCPAWDAEFRPGWGSPSLSKAARLLLGTHRTWLRRDTALRSIAPWILGGTWLIILIFPMRNFFKPIDESEPVEWPSDLESGWADQGLHCRIVSPHTWVLVDILNLSPLGIMASWVKRPRFNISFVSAASVACPGPRTSWRSCAVLLSLGS